MVPLYCLELTEYWYFIVIAKVVMKAGIPWLIGSMSDSNIIPLHVGHNLLTLPNSEPLMLGTIKNMPRIKKIIEKRIFIFIAFKS